MNRKGFTIVELLIVISVIAIISAVLIPTISETYDKEKEEIVDIANGVETVKIDKNTGEPIEDTEGYTLDSVSYANGIVYSYYIKNE